MAVNNTDLPHYSDDLTGAGEYLLDRCRKTFFNVYTNVVEWLRNETNERNACFLLDYLRWHVSATDHQYIFNSGLISLLKDGNDKEDLKENPIRAW